VCCFLLILVGLGPRFAFGFWWIFGDKVELAFDGWAWPLLGLLFAPWTAICYVLAWGPVQGVTDAGWVLVALGVCLDVASYAARTAQSRLGYA
jgi:hypothetical protein